MQKLPPTVSRGTVDHFLAGRTREFSPRLHQPHNISHVPKLVSEFYRHRRRKCAMDEPPAPQSIPLQWSDGTLEAIAAWQNGWREDPDRKTEVAYR